MVGEGAPPGCDQPRRGGNNPSRCKDHKCVVDPLRLSLGFLNVRSLVDNEGQRNVSWRSGEWNLPRVDNKSALLCQELRKNKSEVVGVAETLF